ncbi:MAG: biotin transporter BioY [Clostridia bacterium]|nr:biotin transporter BioY [Clostridia bacterium]
MKHNLKHLTFAALFTATIAVFAQLSIPIGIVPASLQVFIICLCGYFLHLRYSSLAVACYILAGLMGVPVFCHFQGGPQHILSYTGGFIIGFLPLVCCCGIAHLFKTDLLKILLGIAGVVICHTIGVLQYSALSGNNFSTSALLVSIPFLLKDIPLCILAYYISNLLKKKFL